MGIISMPEADQGITARRSKIVDDLRAMLPPDCLIEAEDEMRPFETDAFTVYRQLPLAVVLPTTTEQVSAIMRYCHEHRVKVVARGAGTSLTGGALPTADALILGLSRMRDVVHTDLDNRTIRVQTGISNINVTRAVEAEGFFYAPDPSSQIACTLAGNIGMNSGGAHCLKYGVTTNNIMGMTLVMADGEVVTLGGDYYETEGYDLMALLTGSEGMLGIVTEVTLKVLRSPEAARPIIMGFGTNEQAGACTASIIASGVIPVAIEFMDKPAIHAAEAFAKAGYPLDVESLLIVEVEGSDDEIDYLLEKLGAIASQHQPSYMKVSGSAEESAAIWKGRKSAFGALGQILPNYLCMDGVIPTGNLPEVLQRINELKAQYKLEVANIFHAGDGNLHPVILFNPQVEGETERAEMFGADVLKLCVDVGGCLTGEHGVGIEKRDLMTYQYTAEELAQQRRIKTAFDTKWLLNPAKVFPIEGRDASEAA
jgi:glycolate oxidase